ncbi:Flp family type IVb pilin [Vibrio floridensis]|uniref:Flp family type IVb pilin n=1 Tax=Vibrio floridensis TaxID=2908007 RepID=UPI003AFF8FAD
MDHSPFKLLHSFKNGIDFLKNEEGLSVVEYVVGAALLVLALGTLFAEYDDKLNNKVDSALS